MQSGATRHHHCGNEKPDRLDSAGSEGDPPESGPHAGGDAGQRCFAVLQGGQHVAPAKPLDEDVHYPESVLGADGI